MAAPDVQLPLLGGCFCGAVRYSLGGAPLLVHACHCHNCQTRSGSVYSLSVTVHSADLTTSGPLTFNRRTTAKGRELDEGICPSCGYFLLARALVAPEYATLRAGTLDDAGWAVPIGQAWVESAIPWAVIPGVPQIPPAEFDYHALGEAWRATAPRFREG